MFWFGVTADDGTPHLLLAQERHVIQQTARNIGKTGQSTWGRVVVSRQGRLEFRTHTQYDNLLTEVVQWTAPHSERWPILKRLNSARIRYRKVS